MPSLDGLHEWANNNPLSSPWDDQLAHDIQLAHDVLPICVCLYKVGQGRTSLTFIKNLHHFIHNNIHLPLVELVLQILLHLHKLVQFIPLVMHPQHFGLQLKLEHTDTFPLFAGLFAQ
jgi:hypothetical protein